MPRNAPALPPRDTSLRVQMPSGGNGHAPALDADRFAKIESLLESIQHELEVQFRRIAALQAQLDRSIAERQIR